MTCSFRGDCLRLVCTSPFSIFEVEDWVCKAAGIEKRKCQLERETEKAYLFSFGDETQHWIPKSLCKQIKQSMSLERFGESV